MSRNERFMNTLFKRRELEIELRFHLKVISAIIDADRSHINVTWD